MTFEDAKVIGIGSVGLLILFATIRLIRASGTFNLWAVARRYVAVRIADAESVLDQFGTSSPAGSRGFDDLVPRQQHHVELLEPQESEPAREPTVRQLEKEELIILLAVQRNADGGYLFSANQITTFVGGAAAPIKQIIAGVRGKKEAPAQPKSLYRPVNGW